MKQVSRRDALHRLAAGAASMGWGAGAGAVGQEHYPSRPVRIVVPYAAGASGDAIARLIGNELAKPFGQQFLVDNRPGAAGTMGAGMVASSAPDGYTLLLATDAQMAISPHIQAALPYKPGESFTSIAQAAFVEFVLVVNPAFAVSSVPELVSALKAHPAKYSYASHGIGSSSHLTLEWFKRTAGVDMLHVPYKGSSALLPDVIGGTVQVAFTGAAHTMPLVAQGKLRALATGAAARLPGYPQLPTIAESFPGFESNASWNFFAPKGLSTEIVQRLNAEINRALALPAIHDRAGGRGAYAHRRLARAAHASHAVRLPQVGAHCERHQFQAGVTRDVL